MHIVYLCAVFSLCFCLSACSVCVNRDIGGVLVAIVTYEIVSLYLGFKMCPKTSRKLSKFSITKTLYKVQRLMKENRETCCAWTCSTKCFTGEIQWLLCFFLKRKLYMGYLCSAERAMNDEHNTGSKCTNARSSEGLDRETEKTLIVLFNCLVSCDRQ